MATGPKRPSRPPAVSVLVIMFLLQTAVFATLMVLHLSGLGITRLETLGTQLMDAWVQGDRWIDVALAVGLVLLTAVSIFVAIGLARVRPWAWLWAMMIQGLRLLIGLIAYFRGDPFTFSLLVTVMVVLLLDQDPVRRAFHLTSDLHA